MIFHDNCLLADNSHDISYLFFRKLGKLSENLLSAVVVIDALRVKIQYLAENAHCETVFGKLY